MTPAERERAFNRARAAVVRDKTALMRLTRDDLVKLLKAGERAIREILADQPSDYERWSLPRISAQIRQVLAEFERDAGAKASTAAGRAWELGKDLVEKPIAAALPEARIAASLPLLTATQLIAMRTFLVSRVKDISVDSGNKIIAELGLVTMGAVTPSQAISRVTKILGEPSRSRATTIVRTELARAFDAAAQARMAQAHKLVPDLKKRWNHSGKVYPRLHHLLAEGQVREVAQPYVLKPVGKPHVKLMFPHDPKAPAAETINCGCVSVPHFDFRAPGFKLLTRAEHLKQRGLPADPRVPGLEHDDAVVRDGQIVRPPRVPQPA